MSRVLLVINSLRSGGAERVCVNIANGFQEKGHGVRVLVLNLTNARYQDELGREIPLVSLGVGHARYSIFKMARYILTERPGRILVFNHQLAILLIVIKMVFRLNYTVIARNISNLVQKRKRERSFWHKYAVALAVKAVYKRADRIIAQSCGMKKELEHAYRIPSGKIRVIYNPLLPEVENAMHTGPVNKGKEILFVGRLSPVKGLHYLINAFRLFHRLHPEYILRIAGEGELREALTLKTEEYGLSEHVVFCGYVRDVVPLYRSAAMTVLTSLYEGLPNALIESVALGTPVVAFDCPSGPGEIVEEGRNGCLVPFGDVKAFADRMDALIRNPLDYDAVRSSAKRFSRDVILNDYEEFVFA